MPSEEPLILTETQEPTKPVIVSSSNPALKPSPQPPPQPYSKVENEPDFKVEVLQSEFGAIL